MAEQTKTRTRRDHDQAIAHKRYPKMKFLDGTGSWIAMIQCPAISDDRARWAYRLFPMQHQAEQWLNTINVFGCNTMLDGCWPCRGKERHRMWKIS